MTNITHLDHIAIATHNLEESLHFFEGQLGLTCSQIEDLPERGIRVAFLPIGHTRIELIQPLRDDSEVSSFLEKRGSGIHHLAFSTSNIKKDMDMLTEKGLKLTTKEPTKGAHGCQVAFIHPKSAGGILLELSQASSSDKVFVD